MLITTAPITLLRTSHESFKGTDGQVEYDKAVLLDDEGNKFEMSIVKDSAEAIMAIAEKTDGVATIEAFIAGRGNQTRVKFRLVGFKPEEA